MKHRGRRAQNIWIDCEGDNFMGAAWFWPLRVAPVSTVVVLVPGIAHEERSIAAGLVALGEALADAGLPALLIDLYGCSQSAGQLEDADIAARWRENIRAAVCHARETGATRVIVVGVRLGVPLAVDALAGEPLAALVAWAPITSGKRYIRELKVLQQIVDSEISVGGALAVGGFSIPNSVVECISALDLANIAGPDAPIVMMREMPEGLNALWLNKLSQRGIMVQEQISTEIQSWLFGPAYPPDLPHEDIRALALWCRAVHDARSTSCDRELACPPPRPVIEFIHRRRLLRETFVEIGSKGLTAIFTEPVAAASGHAVRLLTSTVGPGRTFVDFPRDEASRGNSSLRFDFAGFGTSGRDEEVQGGEVYTDTGGQDMEAVAKHLCEEGHRLIYGLGYCSGAWSMMQADVAQGLRAAVAINVQLYMEPRSATPHLARRARLRLVGIAPAIKRHPAVQRLVGRVRQAAGQFHAPIKWLIRLCACDTRLLFVYAEGDPGLDYLNGQIAAGIASHLNQSVSLQTYANLGHLAEGSSARARVFHDIAGFFRSLDDEEMTGDHGRVNALPPSAPIASRIKIEKIA